MTCFKNHTIFIRIEREMKNCMKQFDELRFSSQEQEKTKQNFLQHIAQYDESISSSMRSKGYRCKNQAERTVAFTFGEVTFSRKRWYSTFTILIPTFSRKGCTSFTGTIVSSCGSSYKTTLSSGRRDN